MFMDESIFGVRFDVSGSELRDHCVARAAYHEDRRTFYAAEEKRFADEVDEIAKSDAKGYSNSVTFSNKQRMEQSKTHHQDRARFFKFAAAHLKEEKYKLRQEELKTFELIPG